MRLEESGQPRQLLKADYLLDANIFLVLVNKHRTAIYVERRHRSWVEGRWKGPQKLLKMVMYKEVSKVVIAYPDRLARFGFKILEEFFKSYGTEIIVTNEEEKSPQEELVEDLTTIISHFAGKLYGMRVTSIRR